jgi:acetoacetyl-CoA synthetase
MNKLLWTPSQERIRASNIYDFISVVNNKFSTKISKYKDLYEWSIDHLQDFWETFWNYSGIIASSPFENVITDIEKFPGTEWFRGARLNFAENLLRYKDNEKALIFRGEARKEYDKKTLLYSQLYVEVAQLASALRNMGIKSGDRVVAYMPNIIETVIALLACTSIGAIWASCGSELGSSAVIDRLGQVKPKVLFTVDGYYYKGKKFSILDNIITITKEMNSLEKVIIYPFMESSTKIESINKALFWDEFKDNSAKEIEFEQLDFNHPVFIMFSSGTTGKPKSMVQSAGGVLINHLKELILHTDLKRTDTICYVTSPSWMMWNWLISSLAVGASIVLFNGNPSYPDWKAIWKIIEEEKITIFGTSASYIYYLMKENYVPKLHFALDSLREISQTASPLSEEGFEFIYESIKEDLHFNSIAGGTDINGCFAAGSPILPVYAGQIQSPALAMVVKAYDDLGKPVTDQQGELVCELPSPAMHLYFLDDHYIKKYKKYYFDHYGQ